MYTQQAMNPGFQGGQYNPAPTPMHQQQTGAPVWNGSQWVAATSGYPAPNVGYANAQPQQQGFVYQQQQQPYSGYTGPPQPQLAPNYNLVCLYSDYYDKYLALREEYLKNPSTQNEAVMAFQNADLASRAAHYFNKNPNVFTAPPDLPLPPPPPAFNAPTSIGTQSSTSNLQPQFQQPVNPFSAQAWQQTGQQLQHSSQYQYPGQQPQSICASTPQPLSQSVSSAQNTASVASGRDANEKMQRYVDRCLSRYSDRPENKKYIMQQVESFLVAVMKNGTFRSVDWDTKPLIEIPHQEDTLQTKPSYHHDGTVGTLHRQPVGVRDDYFGPSTDQPNPAASTSFDETSSISHAFNKPASIGTQFSATSNGMVGIPQLQQSIGSRDDYYGPSVTESNPPASTSIDSTFSMNFNNTKKSRRGNQKMFDRRSSSASSTHDSYYGPIAPNPLQQSDSDFLSEDFISIPSSSKKYKSVQDTGFTQTDAVLSSRANRFGGKGGFVGGASTVSLVKTSSGDWDRYMGKTTIGGTKQKLDEVDYEQMTIRGTCQVLEKDYLRLTAPPKAELVRPLPILEQHLNNLKSDRSRKARDYLWYCSQLKAIRQDCTVQRIQNAFTVDVYETHAKIALEENDLNEYNQCQTQLKELYILLSHSNDENDKTLALRNQNEFVAYRLIYYVVLAMESHKYDGGSSDMFKIMLSLTPAQLDDAIIKHALAVREACCSGILDYHAFFRLRKELLDTGNSHMIYLLDRIVPPMRHEALLRICKGYRPMTVPVDFVLQEIGFSDDIDSGLSWLRSCGCVLSEDNLQLLTKESTVLESGKAPIGK